jgi:hypothetical protein
MRTIVGDGAIAEASTLHLYTQISPTCTDKMPNSNAGVWLCKPDTLMTGHDGPSLTTALGSRHTEVYCHWIMK